MTESVLDDRASRTALSMGARRPLLAGHALPVALLTVIGLLMAPGRIRP
jgi:hypothetical protein